MADYQLFRVGKVWHYRFQVAGIRSQRSTRETVKHKADAVAAKAYHRAKLWARYEEPMPTLRELITDWLAVHTPIRSDDHIKTVQTFARLHLYQLGDVLLDEITTEQVETAMLEHLRTHAPASVNQWLSVLKLLCNWAVKRKVMPALPWSVKLLKVQKRPRTVLPVSLAAQWLAAIDQQGSAAVSAAIRLMFGVGLRESEAITARWEWIDWDRRTYTPGITKGREADPVPMPAWLVDYLAPNRKASGLIVLAADGGTCSTGFTRRAMRAANAACGIAGLTPHRLRGTFATLLSEAGVPIQTIQAVMRHKDAKTTMHYLEKNLGTAARAQEAIAQQAGFGQPAADAGE